ncbi:MAG: SUMF1/EgtB/PvdO family nonheme iron enzyme [Planctomycetota bacterium]|nr:SUMF1/EgtB/PvdO family nonheme iron enzyme [Planctomycetota bacterium]
MLGNIAEWVYDDWNMTHYGTYRDTIAVDPVCEDSSGGRGLLKGGNFFDQPLFHRSASRLPCEKYAAFNLFGFRVALSVEAVRKALGRDGPPMPNAIE